MIGSLIHSMVVCPDMDMEYPKISFGEGVYLYDTSGRRYLDAASGSAAVSNIGYGNRELGQVIGLQASKISVLPAHCTSSEVLESYLNNLVAFAPPGFSRAWTVTSGTEAIENAIKLALQYHQLRGDADRFKVIGRWSSYHGNSVFTLDVGGMHLRRASYKQWLNDFPHIEAANVYRKPANMSVAEYSKRCSDALEECILREGPDTVAAFVVEPIVGAALGAVPPPDGNYLQEIRRICTKYGVVLIADEVMTGFGRTGYGFSVERWNVAPDIIATGKGISGGYVPLSAVIIHKDIAAPFVEQKTPFLGGHTFACYPLGAAVGQYVLDYMRDHDLVKRTEVLGSYLKSQLMQLLDMECVGDVRGEGLMLGVELVSDKNSKTPFPVAATLSKKIGLRAQQKGVILYPGRGCADGTAGDHILITPPLVCEKNHLDQIVDTLRESIIEVMNETISCHEIAA